MSRAKSIAYLRAAKRQIYTTKTKKACNIKLHTGVSGDVTLGIQRGNVRNRYETWYKHTTGSCLAVKKICRILMLKLSGGFPKL